LSPCQKNCLGFSFGGAGSQPAPPLMQPSNPFFGPPVWQAAAVAGGGNNPPYGGSGAGVVKRLTHSPLSSGTVPGIAAPAPGKRAGYSVVKERSYICHIYGVPLLIPQAYAWSIRLCAGLSRLSPPLLAFVGALVRLRHGPVRRAVAKPPYASSCARDL
jgi:hypothetical protein